MSEPIWDEIDGIDWDAAKKSKKDQVKAHFIAIGHQIATAFGVPPEVLGLPADPGQQADYALWNPNAVHVGNDPELLAPDECPANTTPHVPGHLGINAMLVNQFQVPAHEGWEGKDSAEIVAAIQKAIAFYKKGHPMPKKVFQAPDAPIYGPAHEVFTSPLIHSVDEAKAKAKEILAKSGAIKIATLDENGEPTGGWKDIGGFSGFTFVPEYATAEPVPALKAMSLSLDYGEDLKDLTSSQSHLSHAITEATVKQQSAIEKQVCMTFLGIDPGPGGDDTVVTWEVSQADPLGAVQISAYDADGAPITQATVDRKEIEKALSTAMSTAPVPPIQIGTPWHQGWGYTKPFAEVTEVSSGMPMLSKTTHLSHGGTLIEYPDGLSTLDLPGKVQTAKGTVALHGKFTVPTDVAKDIVGMGPNMPPAAGWVSTMQWADGEPYVWHPGHGWMAYGQPTTEPEKPPLLPKSWYQNPATGASYTEVEDGVCEVVLTGSVPVGNGFSDSGVIQQALVLPLLHAKALCGLEPMPESFQAPTQWISGEPYVWDPESGWKHAAWAPTQTEDAPAEPEPDLLEEGGVPDIHPLAHLWCTACGVHWMAHKGDPVACDSGGYLRPSTPLEDKQYVARLRMLEQTGMK